MKIEHKIFPKELNAEQNCNFYKMRLIQLQDLDTSEYTTYQINDLVLKMEYFTYLIELYTMESLEEWLYLPNKKIKLKSISELLHFENLYGYSIYEEKDYLQ
jgi:hypothetical protein|tara:strand:- start:1976 stop:2281 length:306 start_codon:yes stop_codon:yes gene_type:complete